MTFWTTIIPGRPLWSSDTKILIIPTNQTIRYRVLSENANGSYLTRKTSNKSVTHFLNHIRDCFYWYSKTENLLGYRSNSVNESYLDTFLLFIFYLIFRNRDIDAISIRVLDRQWFQIPKF